MKQNLKSVALLLMLGCITNSYAQDWPQFLGPNRNSTSPQKNLLRSWPEQGPEVLWRVGVGIGYGGPVIKDGKVYLLDRDDKVGDIMRCFDLSNGKEFWSYSYSAPGSVQFPGSRSVPAVDGDYVYSCGAYGDLYCIDINTHKPVWNVNVWTDFGGQPGNGSEGGSGSGTGRFPTWAISQCPLIYGDLLIIASQAPEAGVVAYDKLTGDVRWKTPSLGEVGYVSPAIVKIDGTDHVVMVTASGGGRGRPVFVTFSYIDSESGETRYRKLKGEDFLQLIVQHVLPRGFRRIRDYGFLHANAKRLRFLLQLILRVRIMPIHPRPRPAFKCSCCKSDMIVRAFRRYGERPG